MGVELEYDPEIAIHVERMRSRLVVSRLHYSYTIRTFDSFREEFCYLFTNYEGLRFLPLFWRRRGVQANMSVRDASGTLLPTLPSATIEKFVVETLHQLSERYLESIPESRRQSVRTELNRLDTLAAFGASEDVMDQILDSVEHLEMQTSQNDAFRDLWGFAARLRHYYLPLTIMPAHSAGGFLELRQSVDLNRPYTPRGEDTAIGLQIPEHGLLELLRFATIGSIYLEMSIPVLAGAVPPWSRTDSIHIQLNLPAGTMVTRRPMAVPPFLFEGSGITDLASVSEDYVYSYLTGNQAKTAWKHIDSARTELVLATENFDAMDRKVEVLREAMGVRNVLRPDKGPKTSPTSEEILETYRAAIASIDRLNVAEKSFVSAARPRLRVKASVTPGVLLLTLLLWTVVGLAFGIDLLGWFNLDRYLSLFAAFLFVVLGVAVFSLDKPFVRHMTFSHVLAATTVFIELLVLRWLF